jgi:hypothetical protein
MKAKTAFFTVVAIATIARVLIGVLLLTAQSEMTTLALRWIFVLGGLAFIAHAIIRVIKLLVSLDSIFRSK